VCPRAEQREEREPEHAEQRGEVEDDRERRPVDLAAVAGDGDELQQHRDAEGDKRDPRSLEVRLPDGLRRSQAHPEQPSTERAGRERCERPRPDARRPAGRQQERAAEPGQDDRLDRDRSTEERRKRTRTRSVAAVSAKLTRAENDHHRRHDRVDGEPEPGREPRQELAAVQVEAVEVDQRDDKREEREGEHRPERHAHARPRALPGGE